jgi:hypothetical protein
MLGKEGEKAGISLNLMAAIVRRSATGADIAADQA